MDACTGWSWLVLLAAVAAGFLAATLLFSMCRVGAYDCGYEDALLDHGIVEE